GQPGQRRPPRPGRAFTAAGAVVASRAPRCAVDAERAGARPRRDGGASSGLVGARRPGRRSRRDGARGRPPALPPPRRAGTRAARSVGADPHPLVRAAVTTLDDARAPAYKEWAVIV